MQYIKPHRNTKNRILHLLTTPIIFGPLPFVMLLDLLVEIYHRSCFPVYGIKYVKRADYINVLDRAKLEYLNVPEKIGCMYCGYINGVLLYMKEITGLTEKYWCGIMHEGKKGFITDPNHIKKDFAKYADEKDFNKKYTD